MEERGVVVGDEHAGDDYAADVEDDDSPEDAADGFGDVSAGVFGLGGGAVGVGG